MQSTTHVVPPDTRIIDDDCLSLIIQKIDLCFSSNKTFSSKETLDEFNKINADHNSNRPLKSIPGAFNFYNEFLKLDDDDLIDKEAILPYEQNLFNKFMKFALIDYAINCERITPVPVNDKRTIFSENIVPLFNYFGNITKTISFRW